MKFLEKNKVDNTPWAKFSWSIGQQKTLVESFFVNIKQAGKQARKHLDSNFPFSDF